MEVTLSQSALADGLAIVIRAATSRSTLPVLIVRILVTLALFAVLWFLAVSAQSEAEGEGWKLYLPYAAGNEGPPPVEGEEQVLALNGYVERAVDCSLGCWRLAHITVLDEVEGGGRHHIFVIARNPEQTGGIPWHVGEGDPGTLITKESDWADFPMFRGSCYDFAGGASGPHSVHMGNNKDASDIVIGVGLPHCHHYSWWMLWKWQPRP